MSLKSMLKFLVPLHITEPWEYGNVNGTLARRHRKTGECQFVLWKKGQQGHQEDYWHRFGDGHEAYFIPDRKQP